MSNQVMKNCKNCGRPTLHLQPRTSHVLHLLLALLSFGLWIIIWFVIAQNNSNQSTCTQCGKTKGLFGT